MNSVLETKSETNDPFIHDDVLGAINDARKELEATTLALDEILFVVAHDLPVNEDEIQALVVRARCARAYLGHAEYHVLAERTKSAAKFAVHEEGTL